MSTRLVGPSGISFDAPDSVASGLIAGGYAQPAKPEENEKPKPTGRGSKGKTSK